MHSVSQVQPQPPSPSKKPKTELSLGARALRLLARRDHTRAELERKLAPYVDDPAELHALLDDFSQRGWLSDTRAIEQVIHAKRARFGAARIRQELVGRGVPADLIGPALENLKASELAAARAVCTRKFKTAPQTAAERARQVRFLQSRGFSMDIALRAIRGGDDDGD
jgi:regulatory protein